MNYKKYTLSVKEWLAVISSFLMADIAVAFFFYRSYIAFVILLVFFLPFYYMRRKEYIKNRKKKLLNEFSEVLYSVSINIRSGHSFENAFIEAGKDVEMFFGEKSLMAKEIAVIKKGLEINNSIEVMLEDLAARSDEEDIKMFSDVCKIAKRNGGNITEVIVSTADRIRNGIYVDNEIETILSEKKLELKIMEAVPFFIMAYLEITSVGYFNTIYQGIYGRVFMTICLIVYILATLLGMRIVNIK